MPPIPSNYSNPTGKSNVLTSFNKWLALNVPPANDQDFTYVFDNEMQPSPLPTVEVVEFQYFNPGVEFFGMEIFPASTYPSAAHATQGSPMELMLQIAIRTDQGQDPNAKFNAYKIRDRIKRALVLAGVSDDISDTVLVDPILVLDYDNAATPTGIIASVPVGQQNAIQERYTPPDGAIPNIHTITLLVRLGWFELN